MHSNITQLFLIHLTCLRSKIEDLYGNSGIHHRKFIGWVSLFRWLGVRYQLFSYLLLSGGDGQAAPRKETTSLYNPVPQKSTKCSIISHFHQLLQVWALSISLSPLGLHHKQKAAESGPTDHGRLLLWPSAGHSWSKMTHSMEQGHRVKLCLFAGRHRWFYLRDIYWCNLFAGREANWGTDHRTTRRNSTAQTATPGKVRDVGLTHLTKQKRIEALLLRRYSHEQGPTEPGKLLAQRDMTQG